MPEPAPPLDLATIEAGAHSGIYPYDATLEVLALVARVRALEADVARLQGASPAGRWCYIRNCTRPVTARDADGLLFCAHHGGSDCTPL